jgi:3-oxoacyl-[acyl-carrier protein] reductase/meso-butanediol dehydrogenase/(S,S)-butanediol dehydrogenase/diacetyl reductase
MYEVADKLAIITGGTRGIGLEIARQLLSAGANVVLNGRNPTDEAADLVSQYGARRVMTDLGSVADPDYCAALIARAADAFGRLDMLVHAAGGPVPGTVMDVTPTCSAPRSPISPGKGALSCWCRLSRACAVALEPSPIRP